MKRITVGPTVKWLINALAYWYTVYLTIYFNGPISIIVSGAK